MGHRNKTYTPEPVADATPFGLPYPRTARNFEKEITTFLTATYEMVSDPECNDALEWSESGVTFIVHSPEIFSKKVLGRYFKHNNFQSYVRQLNMYNFHKIKSCNRWEFFHNAFIRGHPELLNDIKRKSTRKNSSTSSPDKKSSALVSVSANSSRRSSTRQLARESSKVSATSQNEEYVPREQSSRDLPSRLPVSPRGVKRGRRLPVVVPTSPYPRESPGPEATACSKTHEPPSPSPPPFLTSSRRTPMRGFGPSVKPIPLASAVAGSTLPPLPARSRAVLSLQSRSAKEALKIHELSSRELSALASKVRTQFPEKCTDQVVNEIVTRRNVRQLDILDSFYTKDGAIVSRSSSPMPSATPRPSSTSSTLSSRPAKRQRTLNGAIRSRKRFIPPVNTSNMPALTSDMQLSSPRGYPGFAQASTSSSSGSFATTSISRPVSSSLYPMLTVASEGTFFDSTLPATLSFKELGQAGFHDLSVNVLPSPTTSVCCSPAGLPMQTFVDSLMQPIA